jgi:hypothetical protein
MIEVPEKFHALINSAAVDGHPMVAASVDADGQPQLSYYGTLQLLPDGRLAWWARRPDNLLGRLENNPRMTFIYWNVDERVLLRFFGSAAVTTDAGDRDAIFDGSPEHERAADPDRKGTAIVVDLTSVSGFASGEPVNL